MFNAHVAQKPTMAVSDGMKKRMNAPVVWNLLGALKICKQHSGSFRTLQFHDEAATNR
jgi:hypothetical protein